VNYCVLNQREYCNFTQCIWCRKNWYKMVSSNVQQQKQGEKWLLRCWMNY